MGELTYEREDVWPMCFSSFTNTEAPDFRSVYATKSCKKISPAMLYRKLSLRDTLQAELAVTSASVLQFEFKFEWFGLVYWGLTPQQQPGSYQGGEMMMKSVFLVEETGVPGGNHRPTASN